MAKKKIIMSSAKRRICELDAASIAFYRRNPCIAARDLLGVELLDYQKYILQSMWNASHSCIIVTRNGGKSFVGAIFVILKCILFESQSVYLVASKGGQSKELFMKIEELIRRTGKTAASFKNLKDIAEKETVKSPTNKTGFSHSPESYEVSFYNGSTIHTVNSAPDSARSRRATLVFFDEACYISDELISVCEAFAAQSTDFITSTDESYDPSLEPLKCPTQLVYASSQGDVTTITYQHYKNFYKRMLMGDTSYFACDMTCDVAINPYMNGKKYIPLLTQEKVDAALKADKERALREYYNQPQVDSGSGSIIRWGVIRKNETFYLPKLAWDGAEYEYAVAMDPARTNDNSIIGVMEMWEDPANGWMGRIVNVINNVDAASNNHYKLDSNRQVAIFRETLLNYSGNTAVDYEYISGALLDAGAGGGGVSAYADQLLNNWEDKAGHEHRGLIDKEHTLYSSSDYDELYPDALDKLNLVEPKKWRTKMVEEFIELMKLGLIQFPYEYGGNDVITMVTGVDRSGEEIMEDYYLSDSERLALMQIDLMKKEITSIVKTENNEKTSVQYALSKEKANSMHDDRFYVAILLAHHLYMKRKGTAMKYKRDEIESNFVNAPMCVSSINF